MIETDMQQSDPVHLPSLLSFASEGHNEGAQVPEQEASAVHAGPVGRAPLLVNVFDRIAGIMACPGLRVRQPASAEVGSAMRGREPAGGGGERKAERNAGQ